MRLFLSSENLGNYPKVFFDLHGENKKLAFTENAKDDWSEKDRAAKVEEHKQQFESEGFEFVELDLREYFGEPERLESFLKDFGGIWVAGGNSFFLRKAFAYSGLDKLLIKLIKEDKIAYGGSSAGSIIVTPNLRGSEHGDYPHVVPKGYKKGIIWEGLNLVPFYIVPHYKSDWWGKEADLMISYLKKENLKYYVLKDGQAVLIDGDKEEFLK
jgi:dipeptidase E